MWYSIELQSPFIKIIDFGFCGKRLLLHKFLLQLQHLFHDVFDLPEIVRRDQIGAVDMICDLI